MSPQQRLLVELRKRARLVVRVVISLAAIAIVVFVLRDVDLGRVLGTLLKANPVLLVLVLVAQAVGVALRLVRWRYMLWPAKKVPLVTLLSPLLISYAVANVTVNVVAAVPRVYLLNRRTGLEGAFIAGTLAQEYFLDTAAVVFWAAAVPFVVDLPSPFHQVELVLVPVAIVLLLVGLALWRRSSVLIALLQRLGLWDRLLRLLPALIGQQIEGFGDGLSATFGHRGTFISVTGLTVAIWANEALIFWLLLQSLGISFDYLQASAVMAFTHVITGIPSVPGFVGTLEAVVITLVLALGGEAAAALAYAVLLHLFFIGPTTVVGLFFAWREGWRLGAKPSDLPS
jgi:uncharacterized protein (TIRG00374 family)